MFVRDLKHQFTLRIVFCFSISFLFIGFFLFFFFLMTPIISLFGMADMRIIATKGLADIKWTMFGVFYLSFPLTYMYYTFISDNTLNEIEKKELEEEKFEWRKEHDPQYKIDHLFEDL